MTNEPPSAVVIVGTGQGATELATALRILGYRGALTMIGEEPVLPYSRPPLSKAYLRGEVDEAELHLRSADLYEREGIELRLGVRASGIDPAARCVQLDDGSVVKYDRLVLATGGTPRRLASQQLRHATNVHTLRSLADATALRKRLGPGVRCIVIGGGYIGLELAAAARQIGTSVTVVEAAPRVLARVASPVISEFFADMHRQHGVHVLLDTAVQGFTVDNSGDVSAVQVASHADLPADVVVVGIGIAPRTELAEIAGLEVNDGIVVDAYLRTSAECVYALGDVARHPDPQHGASRRLESVPNASEQARALAATLLGQPHPAPTAPWFWSDQYDVKLQTVGLYAGDDDVVVRRSPDGRRLCALYLRNCVIVAADIVNSPAEFAAAKKLVAAGIPIDPQALADPSVALKGLVTAHATSQA